MDTWLKRILYSSVLKLIAVIMICIGVFVGIRGIVFIQNNPDGETVYDNYEMQEGLIRKAGFARDFIVKYRSQEVIDTISDQEVDEFREKTKGLTVKEAELRIKRDRNNYLRTIERELKIDNVNIDYFLKSLEDDIVLTNMDLSKGEEYIKSSLENRNLYLVGDGADIHSVVNNVNHNVSTYGEHYQYYTGDEIGEGYEVYVALKNTLKPGDEFYDIENEYMEVYRHSVMGVQNLGISIILLILSVPYLILVVGKKRNKTEISITYFDRIPMEIQICIVSICCYMPVDLVYQIAESMGPDGTVRYYWYGNADFEISMMVTISTFAMMAITLRLIASLVKHIKNGSLLYYIGVFRYLGKVKNYIIKNTIKSGKLKYIPLIATGINVAAIFAIILSVYIFLGIVIIPMFLLLVWSVLVFVFISKIISDYSKVIDGTKDIAEGNIESKIQLESKLPIFNELAESINTIGDGLDKAILKSIKSERLKTELITNVSHDLKTPLTSIISYIDLLKAEQIDNKVAKEYIDILDERSTRLKYLIEDLVEASKAVTGNTKVNIETFSLDELVVQSVGEYTDRLKSSGINIVMQKMDKLYVEGDTKHMWRVTENLLSNITKYAMPNTRAYIEVKTEGEMGVLIIKNISKDELNIDPDELTQRFVRGEESRTTEGSGLGLAIASSLMSIQRGNLQVSIDGDLFKVEVKLIKVQPPKIENTNITLEKQ